MARPNKTGLDYFPLDVDFFADEKIAAISGEFGIKGEITVIKLLCAVYRNGYFILWNEPLKYKLLRDLPGVSPELIDQIVNRLVRWGFFDESLFDSVKVLTSRGIQKRFFSITRRRGLPHDAKYLLAENGCTGVIDDNNPAAAELLSSKTPQSKVKKRIISTTTTSREDLDDSEDSVNDLSATPEKGCAEKVPPQVPTGTYSLVPIDKLAAWMKSETVWIEQLCINRHKDPEYIKRKIDEFAAHCANNGETAKDKGDCKRHFNYWLRKVEQQPAPSSSPKSRTTARHPATQYDNNQHFDDF
jgi:hypothetical protein